MMIDANMYWLPEELFTNESMLEEFMRCIPEVYGVHARYEAIPETGKKQIVLEEPKGCENLNYVQGEYRMEKQLEDMNLAGVDKAILKIPCCHTWLSLEMCRKFNDGLAEHVKKGDGRFAALAVVPPYGGKEALYELERCVKELGMTGSYEFLAAEQIYENIKSENKTMAFVEGASHNFVPQEDAENYPGQFGDTVKICFDYVANWLCQAKF